MFFTGLAHRLANHFGCHALEVLLLHTAISQPQELKDSLSLGKDQGLNAEAYRFIGLRHDLFR